LALLLGQLLLLLGQLRALARDKLEQLIVARPSCASGGEMLLPYREHE
jgi:hypothetical protein